MMYTEREARADVRSVADELAVIARRLKELHARILRLPSWQRAQAVSLAGGEAPTWAWWTSDALREIEEAIGTEEILSTLDLTDEMIATQCAEQDAARIPEAYCRPNDEKPEVLARRWPARLQAFMTDEQYEFLGVMAVGHREAMKQQRIFGYVGKADRSAVVREIIDRAMAGANYIPPPPPATAEARPREILDLYPNMAARVPFEEIPRAFELLHACLAELWKRARVYKVDAAEALPAADPRGPYIAGR
jgi:hypothetical protein